MAEVSIQLFGGEQDGYRTNVDLRGDVPETFFIWRASDNAAIAAAAGKERMILADRLAVLAYRLDSDEERSGVPGGRELRYVRHAAIDKRLPDLAL